MIISQCFTVMVSSQITCVCCAGTWHILGEWRILFRAHVVPECKPVFFNYNFHEKTKKVCIKTRPTSVLHSIEARVLTKQLKNGLLEATLLGRLLPPRNSSSCYFDTVKYVFPSQIWAIPLQPHLYSSSCFILYRFKTKKTNKQQKNC